MKNHLRLNSLIFNSKHYNFPPIIGFNKESMKSHYHIIIITLELLYMYVYLYTQIMRHHNCKKNLREKKKQTQCKPHLR